MCAVYLEKNTRCHTAHIVQVCFKEHDEEFRVLLWSPNSPKLNLIKHLWDVLEQQV